MKQLNGKLNRDVMESRRRIKIMVMEDNEVYNRLLTKKLSIYTESLSIDTNIDFEILSYVSLADCLKNLPPDLDILFLDYYLMKNITAMKIFRKIKEICTQCRIFIISRTNDAEVIRQAIEEGVDDFIFKDKHALAQSCYLVKQIAYNTYR